jgi:hypothetical protein
MLSDGMLLLAMLACLAVDNPNPWQAAGQKDAIHVWARDVPNSAIRELRAEGVIALPPERLWEVVTDTSHYMEFMPYVEEARRMGQAEGGGHYEYQRLAPPLVKKRDYIIKTQSNIDAEAGTWTHAWAAAADRGPPPRADAVRVTVVDGSWTLKRLDADHTHVTYRLFTDPGGAVPRWVANRANSQSIPDLMDAVARRAKDPNYRR